MEQVKPRLLLVVPMLHQGGFERVCVRTARILRNDFEVTIAMFSDADIAYDINGLSVVNLDVPAQDGKLKKMVNVVKRTVRLRKLKKKLRPDLTYSFGPTANLINVLTPVRGQIWTGIRSYMDMDNPSKLKLFAKRSDQVICCSEVIAHELKEKLGIENTEVLYNPYDGSQIAENAAKKPVDMPDFTGKKVIVSMGREDDCKEFWHLIKCLYLIREKCRRRCCVSSGTVLFQNIKNWQKSWELLTGSALRDFRRIHFHGCQRAVFMLEPPAWRAFQTRWLRR